MSIDIGFEFILIILVIYTLILFFRKKLKINTDYLVKLTFIFYLVYVIKLAFFPLPLTELAIDIYRIKELQHTLIIDWHSYGELVSIKNIIFFIPMAAYFYYYKFKKPILKAFLIVTIIEFLQIIISLMINCVYRTADINDVILNMAGFIVAYYVCLIIDKYIISKFENKTSKKGRSLK
jgi:glycopeptide antibiotics resistance protein